MDAVRANNCPEFWADSPKLRQKELIMAIGDELSSIDFQSMIGGPLDAVVRAQAQSAQTSVDFIKAVGLTKMATLRPW